MDSSAEKYGLIDFDLNYIHRKFRSSYVTTFVIMDCITTTNTNQLMYLYSPDAWAIHKIVFDKLQMYSQQYEDKYGSGDTIVIDNCGNMYKMHGVGDCVVQSGCNVYTDYIFKTLTNYSVPLSNDKIDLIKTLTDPETFIDKIDEILCTDKIVLINSINKFEAYLKSKHSNDLKSHEELVSKLNEQIKVLDEQKQKFAEKNVDLVEINMKLAEKNVVLFEKNTELQEHNNVLNKQIAELSEQNAELQEQNIEIVKQNKMIATSPSTDINDVDKLQDTIISQNTLIRKLRNELTTYIINDAVTS